MRKSFKVIANAGISMFAHIVEMGAQFYLVRFALLQLGDDGFAIAVLGLSLQAIMHMLCAGASTATAKCISANLATGSKHSVSEFMSTAVIHGAGTGIIALLTCGVLAARPELFAGDLPAALWGQFSKVALIVGVGSMLAFLVMPFHGFLAAHHRYATTESIRTALALVRVGGIIVAFKLLGASPTLFMLGTMGAFVLSFASYAFIAHRLMPDLRIDPRLLRRWAIRALFGFSLLILLGQMATTLYTQGSKWLVLHLMSAETTKDLALLMKIPLQLSLLFVFGMRVIIPVVSEQGARKEAAATRWLLRRGTRMGILMAVAAIGTLGPLAEPLMRLWLTESYAWLGLHLSIVLVSQLIALPTSCQGQAMLGMGRVGIQFILQVISAALAIAALVLGHLNNLGFGALTLSLVTFFIARGVGNIIAGLLLTKDAPIAFLWQAMLRPLLICLPMGLAVWLVTSRQDIQSWTGLFVGALLSLIAMLLVCLAALPREDRTLLASIVTASHRWVRRG